jgi:ribonuclease HI
MTNPHAVYVRCDGAMDYNPEKSGGVGYVVKFPDSVPLEDISFSAGRYVGGNIERLELEALIQAMKSAIEIFQKHNDLLKNIRHIIFVTDRLGLCDSEKTNPYRIRDWRRNQWRNHEGKPIKNHKLLDELDKVRKKLSEQAYSRIEIIYRPRRENKFADKLAKAGKTKLIANEKLSKKGDKIGRRKFQGDEIIYTKLQIKEELHINVYRKDAVQDEWEVWSESCDGLFKGNKIKIYADDKLAAKLQRGNEFIVKVKAVFTHHVRIYRSIKKLSTRTKQLTIGV